MQNFVKRKDAPPLPMSTYRRRVAEYANRHGDLCVKEYPLEDPLFPKKSGLDYSGCGALWRADHSNLPGDRAQQEFNKVWQRVKLVIPKERPAAIERLRLTLMQAIEKKWRTQEELLLKQLPHVILQAKQDINIDHLQRKNDRLFSERVPGK